LTSPTRSVSLRPRACLTQLSSAYRSRLPTAHLVFKSFLCPLGGAFKTRLTHTRRSTPLFFQNIFRQHTALYFAPYTPATASKGFGITNRFALLRTRRCDILHGLLNSRILVLVHKRTNALWIKPACCTL
jgi:hypothetical protein